MYGQFKKGSAGEPATDPERADLVAGFTLVFMLSDRRSLHMGTTGEHRPPDGTEPSFVDRRRGDFWINAVIGAAVAFVVSMLPVIQFLAPLVGGGAAGYLQNTGSSDGLKVGAAAGAISAIPVVGVLFVFFAFFGLFGITGGAEGFAIGGAFLFIGIVIVVFAILFNAALGAAGGWLGDSMADDPPQRSGI